MERELSKTEIRMGVCVSVSLCAGSFLLHGQRSDIRVACVPSAHWWTHVCVPKEEFQQFFFYNIRPNYACRGEGSFI